MIERALAENIRKDISERGKRRVLVRNMHNPEKFTGYLASVLDDLRIFAVDCTDDDTVKNSFFSYFVGDSPTTPETAFEAGWRSHATEISLCSGSAGLEVIAGLQSIKAGLKDFLLSDVLQPAGDSILKKVCSSFAWSLPTLICLVNYGERSGESVVNGSLTLPPVVIFRKDYGDFDGSDSVFESGMMPFHSVRKYLLEENSKAAPEAVMAATDGDEGLVRLYTGLHKVTGTDCSDLFSMLDSFLSRNPKVDLFARSAAIFGMQFLPEEVCLISGVVTKAAFDSGRDINLWRGHLIGHFSSERVRDHFRRGFKEEEIDSLLMKASGIVLKFRGENSRSFQVSGDILTRAGETLSASEAYAKAAELAVGDLRKAELYKRAAIFSSNETDSDSFLFESAMSYYRGEMYPEAVSALESVSNIANPSATLLLGLCSSSSVDESAGEAFTTQSKTAVPELVLEVLESRELHRCGLYHKAERILLNSATGDPERSIICLVELGEQFYKRGMVECSRNTMLVAEREAISGGYLWLERKAVFTLLKACNRLGDYKKIDSKLSRLIELTLLSGSIRRLVFVYNLYANSQLLRYKYTKALDIYSSALKKLSAVSDAHEVEIVILNNMGVAERKLFLTGDSLKTLMRQVRISVSSGNLTQACVAYGNMARIFIHLSRTESAEDCLETMIEFASLGNITEVTESICYISSQISFMKGDAETAFDLIDQSIRLSIESGRKRRLSLNLVKKGSMLLRLNRYSESIDVLSEALSVSESAGTSLNSYLSEMKLLAAKCFLGISKPVELLSLEYRGNPDGVQKGEQLYYHWLLTGSRQSMAAAAQLISEGLSNGLYYHSYLHMLQEIEHNISPSLAEAIPLVHNYPSL